MRLLISHFSVFMLFALFSMAQPDIKHSIYFKDKKCNVFFNQDGSYIYGHSNGSMFATYIKYSNGPSQDDSYFAKLDSNMDTLWTRKYSGSEFDRLSFIREMPNKNLLLVGTTSSNDGDIWYGHAYSASEIWMLEVDTNGNTIRHQTFGGSGAGWVHDVIISSDGFIYLSGSCTADDYDFACVNYGSLDYSAWVAKYDTTFSKVWIKMYTGSGDDDITLIKEISPNSFVINYTTNSTSPESDPLNAKGGYDILALKIDGMGNTIWKRRYGSVEEESSIKSAVDPMTKSIYFVGSSYQWAGSGGVGIASGDISYKSGTAWILKIDTLGNIKGSKSYGASSNSTQVEDASFFQNNLYVFGRSKGGGADMDINTGVIPSNNVWVGLVDSNVNLVGKYTIQTPYNEFVINSFIQSNQLYLACRFLTNINQYKCDTTNWTAILFNIGHAPLGINEVEKEKSDVCTLSPNPVSGILSITMKNSYLNQKIIMEIRNLEGKLIASREIINQDKIDCSNWAIGKYTVSMILNNKLLHSESFIKN